MIKDTDMGQAGTRRAWVLEAGRRYFADRSALIESLPFAHGSIEDVPEGAWERVALPAWAADIGVNGALLVDAASLHQEGDGASWQRCDWLHAAWLYLSGAFERRHEAEHGPIHSYSFRLGAMTEEVYEHAWVNRIFLFLRRWAARELQQSEESVFGVLPKTEILLTHDVDAINLTPEIRLKQIAFQGFKALRASTNRHLGRAKKCLREGLRFAFGSGDLRTLELIRTLEEEAGVRSRLHFYAGLPGLWRLSPRAMLIDPAYDVSSPYVRREIRVLLEGGWQVGMHQSSGAWREMEKMQYEKERLEEVIQTPALSCRQHWLRFSFAQTWAAQEIAGFREDTTLGFNDRPGFRCSHALRVQPWDAASSVPLAQLSCLPMLFMDSHFYDYQPMQQTERQDQMKAWLDEVRFVRGQVSINWHTHTITSAYGWREGFEELLALLT